MATMAACSVPTLASAAPAVARSEFFGAAKSSVALPKVAFNKSKIVMSMEKKEKALALSVSVALLAAAILPEIAEAAQPGVSPSLNNLLLSVGAGGAVLGAIGIAVAGVSTFDPVNRR